MQSGVRFAPSPTGAFHLGNFRTAWISHYWARFLGTPWVLRFEDIDAPRVVVGAMERQLAEMEALGLRADRVEVQSAFFPRHLAVFRKAAAVSSVYPCFCSRKEVRESLEQASSAPHSTPPLYGGRCRYREAPATHELPTVAWRFRNPVDSTGAQDFIIGRTDHERKLDTFVPAYNWACAVDDFDGNFLMLVRAWDLAGVLDQQRAVQAWLARLEEREFTAPQVFHCALVVANDQHRLEKRTKGVTLDELRVQGLSDAEIVRRLKLSFDPKAGDAVGEARQQITVAELGF